MDQFQERMKDEDVIFHYTNSLVALENILFHRKLRFSPLRNMNDPRESQYWFFGNSVKVDDISRKKELHLGMYLNEIRADKYKVSCFCVKKVLEGSKSEILSADPECYGWNRMRMWAQYADSFRGVCIALSAAAIKTRIKDQLGEDTLLIGNYVTYLPDYYQHDLALRRIVDIDLIGDEDVDLRQSAEASIKENLERFFLTKPIDFRDEGEYRIVVHDPDEKFEYLDISKCIRGVILGYQCHNVYHDIVRNLCDELGVECRQHRWVAGRMTLLKLCYRLGKGSDRELGESG